MDDELHDALTEIKGVGDATADAILETLADHEAARSTGPTDENGDPVFPDADGTATRLMEKAVDAAQAGDDRDAAMYLRRATED